MSISTHHYQCSWPLRFQEHLTKGSISKVPFSGYPCSDSLCRGVGLLNVGYHQSSRKWGPIFSAGVNDSMSPDDSDETDNNKCHNSEMGGVNSEFLRENLEKIVGMDDSKFSGIDLATLIRDKYGRSYDVQLIKKEFMGRNLLALNVMWKYMEQRSFPLSEEEYILRLDDIANTLKCWGAVSHIRNSLAKSKERPRIGKAVSIFIDMDESGARANEWIYK
ncbi:uncharacterized protein LOC129311093 isoform X1 [Prosopis cineraria]|uniref:uncharacterized protein LOC129311093 isoform X1 n=1 Tax=Prosopis cineraria TaxID=364024 RepID=UPI00240F30C3|nr:uncharacterized protein LOC129311093 isoform X1 [Prosopis cineraria]XP_054809056.1 uncharacterized protein LOC129311093 isoform X1 [Prosopis cineraria]XP_054809057.1 uncharacterized protein LOC129311093 isoform X1 [Prosopis cineraria]